MAESPQSLVVWLHGVALAILDEPSTYRYRLTFTESGKEFFGIGARVLSLALPVTDRPTADHRSDSSRRGVSAFLEGLLPEGAVRAQLATALSVPAIDKMSLLTAVGGECAGAVQFLPEGTTPSDGHVRPLDRDELDQLVADLPTYHLPPGSLPQASLAGVQDKALLHQLSDGRWGLPQAGALSTHVIKPQPRDVGALSHLVALEDWALRVARAAGLDAAESSLQTLGGRECVVVRRYDRLPGGTRLHQEDFCQALALDPQAKYESPDEGRDKRSRLTRIVSVAAPRCEDPDRFRRDLLSLVTFNVVIGNGDAHSKNYSILLGDRGQVSLAPLYDCAPVRLIASRYNSTGHVINHRTRIDSVAVDDLIREGAGWGMSAGRARETVEQVLDATWRAAHVEPLPAGAESLLENLEQLWRRTGWGG